jgi:antitoxin MazE
MFSSLCPLIALSPARNTAHLERRQSLHSKHLGSGANEDSNRANRQFAAIRIPERLLEQIGLPEQVDISAKGESLAVRPIKKPRLGWARAFREMARRGDDALLDRVEPVLSTWEGTEWEW